MLSSASRGGEVRERKVCAVPQKKAGGAPVEPLIRLDALRKGYLEGGLRREVFRGLGLRVEAGESVALLGRSGSGKSTLLNLISGIDLPDGGSVRVAGADMGRLSERERTVFRRRHVGFVFQFFNLLPTLTVMENLLLPLELIGRIDADARARAQRLLERVGLADRAESFPDRLSGGEQQRVAVARALVHRPGILLADEPTGNLDEGSSAAVLELFAELRAEYGATLLMVTHSAEIAAGCDRVLQLRAGRLVGAGTGDGF